MRRQIIRWFVHDQRGWRPGQADGTTSEPGEATASKAPRSANAISEVLRTALQDEDWEVQVTAMLVAGQLYVVPLRPMIDHLRLPSPGASGLTRADCRALAAARQVIVAMLDGILTETTLATTLTHMPGVPVAFARCVMGLSLDHTDAACLLITSLTTPVSPVPDAPAILPPAIVRDDRSVTGGRLLLGATGIEMIWIPPVAHWLGDGSATPVRTVVPQTGYFIAKHPLTTDQVRALANVPSPTITTTPSGVALATYDGALQWCRAISHSLVPGHTGATVLLPTADQWEMAARGPDARRYPWGNNIERAAFMRDAKRIHAVASPWGVHDTVGVVAQWTRQETEGSLFACGVPGNLHVAVRSPMEQNARCAVRPVVPM